MVGARASRASQSRAGTPARARGSGNPRRSRPARRPLRSPARTAGRARGGSRAARQRLRRLLESIAEQQRALEQQIAALVAVRRLHGEPAGEIGELGRIVEPQRLVAQVAQRFGILGDREQLAVRFGGGHVVAERPYQQPRMRRYSSALIAARSRARPVAQHRDQVVVALGALVQRDQLVGLAAFERHAREQRFGALVAGIGEQQQPAPRTFRIAQALECQRCSAEQGLGAAIAVFDLRQRVELGEQLGVTFGRGQQRDQTLARLDLGGRGLRPQAQRADRAFGSPRPSSHSRASLRAVSAWRSGSRSRRSTCSSAHASVRWSETASHASISSSSAGSKSGSSCSITSRSTSTASAGRPRRARSRWPYS